MGAPRWSNCALSANDHTLPLSTNGTVTALEPEWETLSYPDDARDGRTPKARAAACCRITRTIPPGECGTLELVFGDTEKSAQALLAEQVQRGRELTRLSGFSHPAAQHLAWSADAFITRRDSTGGMTIVAGYPFFGDWGRDTMIALPGCLLSTGRYEEAKSVLETFPAYERDGLVPNLFPEGGEDPRYNTAGTALLLVNCVWLHYQKTHDTALVKKPFRC